MRRSLPIKIGIGGAVMLAAAFGVWYFSVHPFVTFLNAAELPCTERYTFSGDATPSGYGAAYDVFDTVNRATIFHTSCDSTNATFSASWGDTSREHIIFKTAYRWTGTAWEPIQLSGTPVEPGSEWLKEEGAQVQISRSILRPFQFHNYIAAYSCSLVNGAWKCGCREASCTSHLWQLQAFRAGVPTVVVTTAGNTSAGTTAGTTAGSTAGATVGGDTIIHNCEGAIKTLPSANDAIGQCYSSPRIPYTDTAKGKQGYRLTTWGKTLHKNITLGHTGSQDTSQWSADNTKITFTMSFTSIFGIGGGGVFVYDLATDRITLIAKSANNRGSAFNHANWNEVLYWKQVSGGLALTAVNIASLSERQIILLDGASDASTPAQSWDTGGRWVHSWVAGRGGTDDQYVQSVVIDTTTGQTHPAFPYRPDVVYSVGAGAEHDLYRDSAIWNPGYTSVAAIVQNNPLSNLGSGGQKYVLYNFSNNTAIPAFHSPAHASWSADGNYFATNYGLYGFNGSVLTCLDNDHDCSGGPNDPSTVYGQMGLSFGRLETAERTRGLNQRFVVMPYNGRFQELTFNTLATVPYRQWTGNSAYTIGHSFNTEAGDGTKLADARRQYSFDGHWLLWRSNLRSQNFQAAPGPDDGQVGTTDIFILDVQ